MSELTLTKHHGLGNDFLVAFVDDVPDGGADLARRWCHRTRGIGADGLIFATPATSSDTDLTMTLFNADGSEAEISGNGIRCLAQAARLAGHTGDEVAVATAGGVRRLVCRHTEGDTAQIEVAMGPVTTGPPLADADDLARPGFVILEAATGDVGNPHVVLLVDDLAAVDVSIDGPAIESHWKPSGINVHFVVVTGQHELAVKHWERGAGVTEACGSGATVAATIAICKVEADTLFWPRADWASTGLSP